MDLECVIASINGESKCVITEEGIEVWANNNRQFSMSWFWLGEIKKELALKQKTESPSTPVVERPQAELGLKGYSQL
jgi:hypothetical protein